MKVTVVGMGLIGGSFYKASIKAGFRTEGIHHDSGRGWEDADFIFVCLPPNEIVPWIRAHAASIAPWTAVVDIAGVKRPIVEAMREVPRKQWYFVGGHPMAGREVSGFDNSSAELFVGASMIITPEPDTPPLIISRLKTLFTMLGFLETVVTTPERHDELIAFTSQLCHVIATTYARDPLVPDSLGFTAGSYANMTRIATQDASIWSELYASNRDALVQVLDGFLDRFKALRDAIANDRRAEVGRMIEEGTAAKRQELLDRKRGDENV